jgi:hypothetical protein
MTEEDKMDRVKGKVAIVTGGAGDWVKRRLCC